MQAMRRIIDEDVRFRVLSNLKTENYQKKPPPRIEVNLFDSHVYLKKQNKSREEITKPGMLYEILAMHHAGYLVRCRSRDNDCPFAFRITAIGIIYLANLEPIVRKQWVSNCLLKKGTHELLSMLKRSRVASWDSFDDDAPLNPLNEESISLEEIKAELAKRPHVERPAQRRIRQSKKEKGDIIRAAKKKAMSKRKKAARRALYGTKGASRSRHRGRNRLRKAN